MPLPTPPRLPDQTSSAGSLELDGNFIVFKRRRVGHIEYVPPAKGRPVKQWYAITNDGRRTENVIDKTQALLLFWVSDFLEPLL